MNIIKKLDLPRIGIFSAMLATGALGGAVIAFLGSRFGCEVRFGDSPCSDPFRLTVLSSLVLPFAISCVQFRKWREILISILIVAVTMFPMTLVYLLCGIIGMTVAIPCVLLASRAMFVFDYYLPVRRKCEEKSPLLPRAQQVEHSDGECSAQGEAVKKKRHGCLTAYLIFMMVVGVLGAAIYFFAGSVVAEGNPEIPPYLRPLFGDINLLITVASFALWRWKKWGFWLFAGIALFGATFNTYLTRSIITFLMAPIGLLIMYGILHIGKEKQGWRQLE